MNTMPRRIRKDLEDFLRTRAPSEVLSALAAALQWTNPQAREIVRYSARLLKTLEGERLVSA